MAKHPVQLHYTIVARCCHLVVEGFGAEFTSLGPGLPLQTRLTGVPVSLVCYHVGSHLTSVGTQPGNLPHLHRITYIGGFRYGL